MTNPTSELVKLYYGDIYTGYCTRPDDEYYDLHPQNDWREEYAIRVVDGDKTLYFLLGGEERAVCVTENG